MPEGVPQWMRDELASVGLTSNIIRLSELNDEQREALNYVAIMDMLIDKGIIGLTTENGEHAFYRLGFPKSELPRVVRQAIKEWIWSSPRHSGTPVESFFVQTTLYYHANDPEEEAR